MREVSLQSVPQKVHWWCNIKINDTIHTHDIYFLHSFIFLSALRFLHLFVCVCPFPLFLSFLLFTSVSNSAPSSIYRLTIYAYIYFYPSLKAKPYPNSTTCISLFSSILRQRTILKSVSSFVSICKKAPRRAERLLCSYFVEARQAQAAALLMLREQQPGVIHENPAA